MQVETYEVELIDQNEMQALASEGETLELIESLGLTGQKSLVNKEHGTVVPYRFVTKEEHMVFKTLFPQRCKIEDYKDGPIPLRVLQVAAHVKELAHPDMGYLEVWYPEQGIDDPVLVARKSSYTDPVFLIARWGQALLPLSELRVKAVEQIKLRVKSKLKKAQLEINAAVNNIENYCDEKLSNNVIPDPSIYL